MMPIYMSNASARILILPTGETRSRFRSDNPASGLSYRAASDFAERLTLSSRASTLEPSSWVGAQAPYRPYRSMGQRIFGRREFRPSIRDLVATQGEVERRAAQD